MPQDEYFIYLVESFEKTKDGFSLSSQDLIISSINKYANTEDAIGKIITGDPATLIFKDRKYFNFIERITKSFSIQNFGISVSSNLTDSIKESVDQSQYIEDPIEEPTVEEKSLQQSAKILRKGLQEVFACPHLEAKNDSLGDVLFDPSRLVKDMDWKDAYNCLFSDKQCPLKQMCMNGEFLKSIASFTDFNLYDLYLLEFENHDKKYNLAISKTQMGIVPIEEC